MMPRRYLGRSTLGALALTLSGCASSAPTKPAAVAPDRAPTEVSRLLPLEDRSVSSFRTRTDTGEEGLLVLEFYRPRPGLAEIDIAGRIQRLYVRADAVELATGGYLLRAPLEPGRTFQGAFGQVRIARVDATLDVPAGHLTHCLVTVEEAGNPPKRVETTFCPDVGVARLVVEAAGDSEVLRLETDLVSHGPRVDLQNP